MNEGTRHEKAAIVAVSYIIGFTAAFILFTNFAVDTSDVYEMDGVVSTAAVVNAVPAKPAKTEAVPAQLANTSKVATYNNGLLQVDVADQSNLLSFNVDNSDINADITTMTQGFHYGELTYSVSNDDKFVFFCERHEANAETCTGYVYDISADRIFPVAKSGAQPAISASSAAQASWVNEGLKIGSNYSASPTAPWVLIGE